MTPVNVSPDTAVIGPVTVDPTDTLTLGIPKLSDIGESNLEYFFLENGLLFEQQDYPINFKSIQKLSILGIDKDPDSPSSTFCVDKDRFLVSTNSLRMVLLDFSDTFS